MKVLNFNADGKTELGNNFNVKIKIQEPLKFSNHTSGGNSIHHISYSLPTNQLTGKNKLNCQTITSARVNFKHYKFKCNQH